MHITILVLNNKCWVRRTDNCTSRPHYTDVVLVAVLLYYIVHVFVCNEINKVFFFFQTQKCATETFVGTFFLQFISCVYFASYMQECNVVLVWLQDF